MVYYLYRGHEYCLDFQEYRYGRPGTLPRARVLFYNILLIAHPDAACRRLQRDAACRLGQISRCEDLPIITALCARLSQSHQQPWVVRRVSAVMQDLAKRANR